MLQIRLESDLKNEFSEIEQAAENGQPGNLTKNESGRLKKNQKYLLTRANLWNKI